MIGFAAILLAGKDWLLPALGAFAVGLAFVISSYIRSSAAPGLKFGCAVLKIIGLAALIACLLEPMWSGQRAKPGSNLLLLAADNSQSLRVKDGGETQSRGELMAKLLTGEKNQWRAELGQNFDVRSYLFDSRLQATKDFSELNFEGRASAVGHSLKTLGERFRGQPIAGIVMLTDGDATDLADASGNWEGLPPVYPVLIGREQPARDIAIVNTTVSQTSFEDAPVTVQADVTATGYRGQEITGQLVALAAGTNAAPTNKVAAELTLTAPRDSDKMVFRFQFRPEKTGVLFYRLRIAAKGEMAQFDKPDTSTEATLANNETVVVVDRGRGPYRVLYVSGRPNWEYKFLHRAVEEDDQTQLVGLIRIAKREPKFEFRGRAGESSNPLFRGFGNQSKEEIERYDQPVLVRLNTRDEFELRAGFPKTPEDLFGYHAVILDDLESEFFTADQHSLLQKFVSERGGGFLMLGGAESFREGNFQKTGIGDLLPVYLDQRADVGGDKEYRLSLTREGWLQPWARLRNNEGEERKRLADLPHFDTLNHVREFKPGAMVVATVTDGKKELPALVTQRFGRGRTAALLIGDLWQSGLGDEARQNDLKKGWRQLVRWLVADVPEPVEIRTESQTGDADGAMKISVRVRDQKFQPLDNATVSLKVTPVPAAPPVNAGKNVTKNA
ncbi:MAG: hypothetical protein HY301_09905, partial [Verrucomicrobia bacterium]|nr:hypothetical protein [Verrucomicrobiota bacterium]